nr:unnamed protein product [Spirometra erinaceieuropaei]
MPSTNVDRPLVPPLPSSSSSSASTSVAVVSFMLTKTTHSSDTSTNINTTTVNTSKEDPVYTCPDYDRTFTSHIGLLGHLQIQRTETGKPVPRALTCTTRICLPCPHYPRTFMHQDPGNWSDNLPLALLGIRAALKSDLGCSAVELVFGTTLRLPGEMITPASRGADETPDNLVHRLRQFMRSLYPVPPRTPMTESYVEKDLDKCTHVIVRCARVRQPLESPYEGPFRVLARSAKTFRILRSDKEDVVSVDRVKAAVAEEPPDRSQGQKCADPLTPVPPSSLSPTRSPCPLPCPSPPLPSIPPFRILPLPPFPQPTTATTP